MPARINLDPLALKQLYVVECLPAQAVADRLGVSKPLVLRSLRKAKIPVRPMGMPSTVKLRLPYATLKDKSWMKAKYAEMSVAEIAEEIGCSVTPVSRWLKIHGIKRRSQIEVQKLAHTRGRATSYFKGRHLSEETRQKIRAARAANPWKPPPGWGSWNKGRKKTPEHQAKITASLKKTFNRPEMIERFSGPNHYNWKGGTSFLPHPPEFSKRLRRRIRKRDWYTCQICGIHQKGCKVKLSVHHVDYDKHHNYGKTGKGLSRNLISSCVACHMATNHNRPKWIEYFRRYWKIRKAWERFDPAVEFAATTADTVAPREVTLVL